MSSSGWEAWSAAERIAFRHLKLALESLCRLQASNLPENEKRIAAATYLECLLSSLAAALLHRDDEGTVRAILEVYDRIWHS